MTTPPPRKRYQIHLSTAIVMMFVAGVLIWANTKERNEPWTKWGNDVYYPARGWPINTWKSAYEFGPDEGIMWPAVVLDMVFAFVFLLAVWFLCEWLIRRRAARKGA